MLSFELKQGNPPEEMEIFLDGEGLDALLAQLRHLQAKKTDHVHLMSNAWGGSHLDEVTHADGNSAIHHVKIFFRDAPGAK